MTGPGRRDGLCPCGVCCRLVPLHELVESRCTSCRQREAAELAVREGDRELLWQERMRELGQLP